MTQFTAEDKFKEARRELAQRKRVYPRLVAQGSLKQAEADRQIAIMEAIRDDYARAIQEPLL